MISDGISADKYAVRCVSRSECSEYILSLHYAGRWPSISYAYGLFNKEQMVGVVTYGTPPSAPLRKGIAGEKYIPDIIELNRLCLRYNNKNEASLLISRSLKMLPKNKIVISFADPSAGHVGKVYQASNFTYYGLSAKRTDWKVKGLEHLHGQTIADQFRGVKNRSEAMRNKYGEDFYLAPRPQKHRYIFIIGDKRYKKRAKAAIKYNECPYP